MKLIGATNGFVRMPFILEGLLIGFINGITLIRFKIPPMIMTLGMMYIARGIVYILTVGVTVYPLPAGFTALEQSTLLGLPSVVRVSALEMCLPMEPSRSVTLRGTSPTGRAASQVKGRSAMWR